MFTKPDGNIIAETRYDGFGSRSYIKSWEGSRFILLSSIFVPADARPSQLMRIGPYKLRLLRQQPWTDGWLAVRIDRWSWFYVALYKTTRILELIYYRLILTLAVWQLADTHPGTYPDWRDIKLVRWFSRMTDNHDKSCTKTH